MEIRNDQNHNYFFIVLILDRKAIGFKGNVRCVRPNLKDWTVYSPIKTISSWLSHKWIFKLTSYRVFRYCTGRIERWCSLDKIKRLSSSSIQLAPDPLTVFLSVKLLIPFKKKSWTSPDLAVATNFSEHGLCAKLLTNKDIIWTNRIVNRVCAKGKILLNFRVIASHSSSYWISYGPGLDGMSIT